MVATYVVNAKGFEIEPIKIDFNISKIIAPIIKTVPVKAISPAEFFAEQLVLATADIFSDIAIPKSAFKPIDEKPAAIRAKAKAELKKQMLLAAENSKATIEENNNDTEKPSCDFVLPETPEYDAQFIAVRKKGIIGNGEIFETKVYIQNKSNVPWFSEESGCKHLIINLGTDKTRDRDSVFYTEKLLWESGWGNPARIKMETPRVEPNEIALFHFWSRAPIEDGYYREFFTPVVEGITWIDQGLFYSDFQVGEGQIAPEHREEASFIDFSADISKFDLSGGKSITIIISQQKMLLKIGELLIREFPVSTGKASTPTPLGNTIISHKQEVRVSGSWPHYIMPKWMTYRGGGYGIHALPSLANDGGVFWTEALNHIGERRSHGCIRLLPWDAEYAYNFADIGTPVTVKN